jgi:hypothetical protein
MVVFPVGKAWGLKVWRSNSSGTSMKCACKLIDNLRRPEDTTFRCSEDVRFLFGEQVNMAGF